VLTTLALAGGLSVVAMAAPASAHTGDLKANAVCNTTTGQYDVTYTLALTQVGNGLTGSTKWKVGTTSFTGTPGNANGLDRGPISSAGNTVLTLGTESLPGSTVGNGPWVYAYTKWNDGFGKGSDGRIEGLKGDCDSDANKITYCHATSSDTNPYSKVTTSINAFVNSGHIDHAKDIYPAFSYKKNGKTVDVPAKGDQSLLQYGDCAKPFDWNWEYAAPTCKALTVVYPKNIPSGQANDVNVRVIADGKEITLNFHKSSGTWSGTQTFTFDQHKDWTDPDIWSVVWVQVAGTNYHWQGKVDCGDAVTVCHWDASSNGYDKETIAVKSFFAGKHDAHAKDIYPAFTYTDWWLVFPIKKTQAAKGDQTLLQYPDCTKPPTEVPAPAAPAFSDTCGPDNEVFTEPVDTDKLDWTTTYTATSITVKLAAKAGFALPVGTQTEWTYPIDDAPCVIGLEGVPSFDDTCGPANEKLTVPASTEQVLWASSREGQVITVTATAAAGLAFPEGTTTSWTFDVNDAPCVIGLQGVPSFDDTCGPANEKLTVPASTEQVLWASSREGQVITVTATAAAGFAFPEGTTTSWTFDVNDAPCVIGLEGAPSFEDTCGPANETVTLPKSTEQVLWASSREGQVITVTATAAAGFAFPEGTTTSWTFDVNDEPCIIEVVGAPTFADECGAENHELSVPESTETIEWTSSEKDGVITVTATAKPGSKFTEGAQSTWTFTINDEPCITELVGAPTFADVCGPDNEVLVVPEDTDTVDWSQVEAEGVVTVTAAPKAGFAFAGDVQTTWAYAIDDAECIAPTLDGSFATGQCIADAPWIFYEIELTDPDHQSTSNVASLVLTDGTNSETIELGELVDGALSGKLLWPGASVADDGVTPTGWPGWEQLADGTWQETEGNFAWTRSVTEATIVVNPEMSVALSYPPATPNCANGPTIVPTDDGDDDGTTGGGDGESTTAGGGTGLASTGFAGTGIAIVAGIIVLAGAAFLVIARVRRKRA